MDTDTIIPIELISQNQKTVKYTGNMEEVCKAKKS